MSFVVLCTSCGSPSQDSLQWQCRSCEGPLTMEPPTPFETSLITPERSLWRYRRMLPFFGDETVSMGEGLTPLISIKGPTLLAKLDYVMPTGSFKDRGSSVMLSSLLRELKKRRVEKIVEDSSGNAGASVAAYSAFARIPCEVYAPQRVSEAKARQIEAYGARLVRVSGTRNDVAKAAQEAGGVYVSHVWNPHFTEAMKTAAYEIAEQMSWTPPEYVFTPVSVGTLLLGLIHGFRHLKESGVISSTPKVVAVQAKKVSPVYHAFHGLPYAPPSLVDTVADALISTNPPRLRQMVAALRDAKGLCLALEEEEILQARDELGRIGIYVEPSGAVAYAGWKRLYEGGSLSPQDTAVILLTGSGLKTALPTAR